MQYPNKIQYKEALQNCARTNFLYDNYISFTSLEKRIRSVWIDNSGILMALGRFSVTFKIECEINFDTQFSQTCALKCFTGELEGREDRQKKIVEYLQQNPSIHIIDYQYLEDELIVNEGEGMKVSLALLEWVEAPTLGEKIKKYCITKDKYGLFLLAQSFSEFALWLLKQPFSHGDLNHDNLFVDGDGCLVVIDYDGMYIPAFEGMKAIEVGEKDYQHPKRTLNDFNANLDDFSILVIYISLLALSENPELYQKYNNGQNIIFNSEDFVQGEKSPLIQDLSKYKYLTEKIEALLRICQSNLKPISNLENLLDPTMTKEEFVSELKATHELTTQNYAKLHCINVLRMDQSHFIEGDLYSLIAITNQLFEGLLNKMNLINESEDNPISEGLWNTYPENLKQRLIFNCKLEKSIEKSCHANKYGHRPVYWSYDLKTIKFKDIEDKLRKIEELIIPGNGIYLNILKYFKSINKLYLDGSYFDLNSLNYLENLHYLELVGVSYADDLITRRKKLDYNKLSSLRHLVIKNSGLNINIGSFLNCKSLEKVELTNPYRLSGISELHSLITLKLEMSDASIESLANSESLLNVEVINNRSSLAPLAKIPNLKSLKISYDKEFDGNFEYYYKFHQISNEDWEYLYSIRMPLQLPDENISLDFLSMCFNVEHLELAGKWENIKPIEALINLTSLVLDLVYLEDLSPLCSLKNLRVLKINKARYFNGGINFNFISELNQLEELKIVDGSISDSEILLLRNLTKIKKLDLRGNTRITNISVLENLTELEELNIEGCRISDFQPLLNLKKLNIQLVIPQIESGENIQNSLGACRISPFQN